MGERNSDFCFMLFFTMRMYFTHFVEVKISINQMTDNYELTYTLYILKIL